MEQVTTGRTMSAYVRWFRDVRLADVGLVGGKTASLGELYSELKAAGVRVPNGFAVTAEAYRAILDANGLRTRIAALLAGVTSEDVAILAAAGAELRRLVREAPWPAGLQEEVIAAYRTLASEYGAEPDVAVRSSATAEDLPQASFAGQHESYLGVRGEAELLAACRQCFASIFTDRAIVYRIQNGFDHLSVLLSVAVQRMVASGRASSGVMFTLDPDSGFRDVVLINGAFGMGEAVVQGQLDPDEFLDLQAHAPDRPPGPAEAEDRAEDLEARDGSRRAAGACGVAAGDAAHGEPLRR